jgi:hypothetical protein
MNEMILNQGGNLMRKWQFVLAGASLGLLVLSGCTTQLSPADRNLLNQALDSGQMATQQAAKAQTAAGMASDAAARAEDAAMRAESAAAAVDKSAGMASASADAAAASAAKAAKAFEMGQMK